MEAEEVLSVYAALAEAGVTVRVDGGWCVDALTPGDEAEVGELGRSPRGTGVFTPYG